MTIYIILFWNMTYIIDLIKPYCSGKHTSFCKHYSVNQQLISDFMELLIWRYSYCTTNWYNKIKMQTNQKMNIIRNGRRECIGQVLLEQKFESIVSSKSEWKSYIYDIITLVYSQSKNGIKINTILYINTLFFFLNPEWGDWNNL